MRSKDRLEELRHLASGAGVYCDTVLELPALRDDHEQMEELFKEVEQIRGWIHDVEQATQLVRRLHSDPTYHADRQLQQQLDAAAERAAAAGLRADGALRRLAARGARPPAARAAARMARLQAAAGRRLAAAALERHAAALQLLRDDRRRLLREQIRLMNLTISDEECEHLLETDNIALFVDNLRAETAEARLALRDAEARRDELARVEASLQAVRDLFLQLAQLVATQQEQVDSVEYYALQAGEHVESGGQQLLKGTVGRNKTRKKKLGLLVCLGTGLLVLVLVLVLS